MDIELPDIKDLEVFTNQEGEGIYFLLFDYKIRYIGQTLDFQTPDKLKAYIKDYKDLFSETLSTLSLVD